MSQAVFSDPIVVSGPTRTGTGNGTCAIDKLTHFTIAQTYTLTCIAKSPDTLFSVVGSLDGSVGIATVGTQFFDQDLKVFLTINQGSTAFEVGDQFVFEVDNGTDLNQANIDSYDEQPQKNFGAGTLGLLKGDHNLRYSNTALKAYLYLQDLLFQAKSAGSGGDAITIAYTNFTAAVAATKTIQNLIYEAVAAGAAGNSITIEYENFTPAVKSTLTVDDIRYDAQTGGVDGDNITIEYVDDATAGAESVNVTGLAVTIHIEDGVSTANQIITAVEASAPAMALIEPNLVGTGTDAQSAPFGPTNLAGGADAIGLAGQEVVTVVGNAIKVKFESGVSTAAQLKTALDNSVAASALVRATGTGSPTTVQTAPVSATNLEDGADAIGLAGSELVTVVGNAISVRIQSGVSTATQVKVAIDASGAASALVDVSIIGTSSNPQFAPEAARNLSGGKNKSFAFNHDEFTDSGAFAEGNGNLKIKDLIASGSQTVAGQSHHTGVLSLKDSVSANNSGPGIPNAQKYINALIQAGHIAITGFGLFDGSSLTLLSNLEIVFTDNGNVNYIDFNNTPIAIGDGESLYVALVPGTDNLELEAIVSATIPQRPDIFRVCTRVDDALFWFNGSRQKDNELIEIGNPASFKWHTKSVLSGGGTIEHGPAVLGRVVIPSNLSLKFAGSAEVITINSGTFNLTDGHAAYVSIYDFATFEPFTTSLSIQTAALTSGLFNRPDKYWLFMRIGSLIFFRNGTSLALGESARINSVGSASENIANAIVRRDADGGFIASECSISDSDIDGGTASNAHRITVPKDTKANLDALVRKAGTIVFATDEGVLYIDDGADLIPVGSGSGGGGGSINWHADNANAPVQDTEFNEKVFKFESGLGQEIYTYIKVPQSYAAGAPITMYITQYSPASSGTQKLQSTAYLIRKNTDAIDSTTNSRASTNSALTNTVAKQYREAALDLTDSSGEINGVAVAPGDLIKVVLTRGSDTDTDEIRFVSDATEVTFND